MKALVVMIGLGGGLIAAAAALGGKPAAIGGSVALVAQVWAVALLRPAMRAPNPQFMARWLGGMGIRAVALGGLIAWSATHPASLPPLPAAGGYLGVVLPLLFLETRFLR